MGKAARRKHDQAAAAPATAAAAAPPRRPPRARPAGTPGLALLAGAAVIVALGLALYANSFSIPFLFDDHFEITTNPAVKTLEPISSYLGRSRGLTLLSFALNARSGGMQVWGFHAVNVTIHIVNALLVYALVLRTMTLPLFAGRYARRAPLLAALTGCIFVAHPLQTMAASYIVQRAESLAALWYLLAVLAVGAALASDGRRRLVCLGAALFAAALGVASKEVAATLPAAALAYVVCFGRSGGTARRRGRWLLPLVLLPPLLYALWLALPYLWPAATDPFNPSATRSWIFVPTAGFQTAGVDAWHYLLTQFGVITWYLRLYVLPTAQCFDYGWPIVDGFWRADVLAPLLLLLAIVAAAVASLRRYPLATFCIAWFFITLSPASSFIPLRDAAFEHRMYLPLVGLAWLTVVGGADLLAWLAPRLGAPVLTVERAGVGALALWIALLGVLTLRRNEVLSDPIALATDSAIQAPHHWRPRFELGAALMEQGRNGEAIEALREAVRLGPGQGAARVQLAGLLLRAGQIDEAEAVVRPATDLTEESVVAAAYQQLANIYQKRGDYPAAADALLLASRAKPQWASLHQQRARLLSRDGSWFVAATEYNRAIVLKPSLLPGIRNEAVDANLRAVALLARQGKPRAAINLAEKVLTYDPSNRTAQWQIAAAASAAGDWERAERALGALQAATPNDSGVAAALEQVRARQVIAAP